VVQVEVGEGARRKKQTHHNPIFSQVIKSRMAIRLVFHWGPDVDIDRSSGSSMKCSVYRTIEVLH